MTRLALLLTLFALVSGCTHSLHLAHVSDFSPTFSSYNKGELVKAKGEQFVVLGMVGNTNYVEDAYAQLLNNCEGGAIQGITTLYSTSHGFFSWTNFVELQGLCLK